MRGRWTSLLLLTAGLLAAGCRTRGMCPMAPEETSGRGEAWNALHEFASGDPDAIPAAVLVLTREVPIARYKPLFMTLCEGPDPLSSPDGGERVKSLRDLLSRDDAEGRRQGVLRVLWYASDDWVSLTPDLGPTDAQSPYGEAGAALVDSFREGRAPERLQAAELLYVLRFSRDPEVMEGVLETVLAEGDPRFRELCAGEVGEERLREDVAAWARDLDRTADDMLHAGTADGEREQETRPRGVWALQVLGSRGHAVALREILAEAKEGRSPVVLESLEPAVALAAVRLPGPPGIELLTELAASPVYNGRWLAMSFLYDRDPEIAEQVVLGHLLRDAEGADRVATEILGGRGFKAETAATIEAELRRRGAPLVVEGEVQEMMVLSGREAHLRYVRNRILERLRFRARHGAYEQ